MGVVEPVEVAFMVEVAVLVAVDGVEVAFMVEVAVEVAEGRGDDLGAIK